MRQVFDRDQPGGLLGYELSLFLFVVLMSVGDPAHAAPQDPPAGLPAASWILVDAESGEVLASRDQKTPSPIASATKLMTYFAAREKLRPGREVVVAPYDASAGESLAGLEPGDGMLARDLFYGLLVPSGNDAAVTLALATSGSEADFVSRMNASAADLGLSQTDFFDPIGISSGNVSSAQDLVDLTLELREDELFREIVNTPRVILRSGAEPIRIENRNTLVHRAPFITGVKTGTTLEAGYILVASGERMGIELLSAVLGSPDAESRDSATLELLDFGFSLYGERVLADRGQRMGSVPLAEGGRLPVEAGAEVIDIARADQAAEFDLDAIAPVSGPIGRGDSIGSVVVRLDGEKVAEVDALASRAVPAARTSSTADGHLPLWAWLVFAGAGLVAAVLAGFALASHRRRGVVSRPPT